jgi:RNA polymerase sigma-70 factor (ECF subfamily)
VTALILLFDRWFPCPVIAHASQHLPFHDSNPSTLEMSFDFPRRHAVISRASKANEMSEPIDPEFFQHLVHSYYQDLYRFAFSLAKRQEDASDLVQQVFSTWAAKGHQLLDKSKAKSWLFTTLHRDFLHRNRKSQRGPQLLTSEEANLEEMAGYEPSMERALDGASALEALDSLEEPFGAPLRLFYLSDMNYKEIAETLGVPMGTVMSRLSRGKALLRERLEHPTSASPRS